ncbi:MAG: EAL domain-containing protein [Actinobacteria bacterium]|nr:EAL domain-containing protein [Actinomycetota bacterium]
MKLPRRSFDSPTPTTLRVLVVESNPADLLFIDARLRAASRLAAALTRAPTLDDAVTRAQTEQFDVVLCHLQFATSSPGIETALATVRRALGAFPDIPIVVISESADRDVDRKVIDLGAQDHVAREALDDPTWGAELLARTLVAAVDRHRLGRLRDEMEQSLNSLVEASPDGMLAVRRDRTIAMANTRAGVLLGQHVEDLERARFPHEVNVRQPYEVNKRGNDNNERILEVSSTPGSWLGEPAFFVSLRDATPQVSPAQQAAFHANYDSLTGLPTSESFHSRVDDLIYEAKDHDDTFAVLLVDLDQFQSVNRSFGHPVGDAVLKQAAGRLTAVLPPGAPVARLGGDEFAAAITNQVADPPVVAQHIASALGQPYRVDDNEVHCSASVGVAWHYPGCRSARELVDHADDAMSLAHDQVPGQVRVFDRRTMVQGVKMLRLKSDLRDAVHGCDLWMAYQPIVSIAAEPARDIVGLEALCRWEHPDHGLIPPVEFIKVAEDSGLIVPLGDWILRDVCEQIRAWRDERPDWVVPPVSVNVSARQLFDHGLPEAVLGALRSNRLEPSAIQLEVTETAILAMNAGVEHTLKRLASEGIAIHLDDFGTGYSSLAHLRRFPISTLKVDRSFVAGLPEDEQSREIVRAVIAMGSALGIDVIAEGVEGPAQLNDLRDLGCQLAQGYLFDVPAPAPLVTKWFPAARDPIERRLASAGAGC